MENLQSPLFLVPRIIRLIKAGFSSIHYEERVIWSEVYRPSHQPHTKCRFFVHHGYIITTFEFFRCFYFTSTARNSFCLRVLSRPQLLLVHQHGRTIRLWRRCLWGIQFTIIDKWKQIPTISKRTNKLANTVMRYPDFFSLNQPD